MSADKYSNFAALSKSETLGVDYRIRVSSRDSSVAIIAPHGGGIEPHTSTITIVIAGDDFRSYLFEGIKKSGNRDLHITSHHFDEPQCLNLIAEADTVVAIHGWAATRASIGVGGLDTVLRNAISLSLKQAGFAAETVAAGPLSATDAHNICNRGRAKKGVQLEITEELRNDLKGERLEMFATAVRKAIRDSQLPSLRDTQVSDNERRAVTSGHGEDIFHMRLWRATQHLIAHADDTHPGMAFDKLAAMVLAFNTLEAYLNFVCQRLAPEVWAKERDFFSRQPYHGFAGKIKFVFEKSGLEEPPKDVRPYSSVWDAKEFRDLVAHGKSEREDWEIEHPVNEERPNWVPRFELVLRNGSARQFADDIEEIIEKIHAAIYTRFEGDMAFHERALSGFLGYSSQTTRVVK